MRPLRRTVAQFVPGDRPFLTGHTLTCPMTVFLAALLHADIVEWTRRAADIGDRDWRALLDAHDAIRPGAARPVPVAAR